MNIFLSIFTAKRTEIGNIKLLKIVEEISFFSQILYIKIFVFKIILPINFDKLFVFIFLHFNHSQKVDKKKKRRFYYIRYINNVITMTYIIIAETVILIYVTPVSWVTFETSQNLIHCSLLKWNRKFLVIGMK